MRCADCALWQRPSERTDWGQAVSLQRPESMNLDEFEELEQAIDREYGICQAITLSSAFVAEVEALPLATVRDGSDYRATLYTQAEFGCALFREKR